MSEKFIGLFIALNNELTERGGSPLKAFTIDKSTLSFLLADPNTLKHMDLKKDDMRFMDIPISIVE